MVGGPLAISGETQQRCFSVANLRARRRQAEDGMQVPLGGIRGAWTVAQGAESITHAAVDVIQSARCGPQMTRDRRRAPMTVTQQTRCMTHGTCGIPHHARCGNLEPSATRQKPCCMARKTPSKGRDARCRQRGTRCIERLARCICQRTSNRPQRPIFYIEYKPLVPSPLVLGEGGLVRSWQEIGTYTSHGQQSQTDRSGAPSDRPGTGERRLGQCDQCGAEGLTQDRLQRARPGPFGRLRQR
jgi:hypothetical protein